MDYIVKVLIDTYGVAGVPFGLLAWIVYRDYKTPKRESTEDRMLNKLDGIEADVGEGFKELRQNFAEMDKRLAVLEERTGSKGL